jgi:hypothetical protein
MENIIHKALTSKTVQRMATSQRMKEREVWSLFFDSGCDYLDQLRHRITHYNVFKAQFGELLNSGSLKKTTVTEAFQEILASPDFWNWWSSQLWRVCNAFSNISADEIHIRLMFNTSLIPQKTLDKIFINEKRQEFSREQEGMPRVFKHRTEQVC